MKKKTIVLDDKTKTLEFGYGPVDGSGDDSMILVVENKFPKFRIIENFTQEETKVEEESTVQQNIYYAEEIFDDEDDIYKNVLRERRLKKESYRTIADIGATIDKALLSYGFKTDIGLFLLASMQFSRLIYLPQDLTKDDFVKTMFSALNNPVFFTSSNYQGHDDFLAYEDVTYRAIEFANNNKNRPVFIYTDGLTSKYVFEYYRHFYQYIDSPESDSYLTALGKSQYIPHNLYFIFSLNEGECVYDIARRLFRYVSFIRANVNKAEANETKESVTISLEELSSSLREAGDTYGIKEDLWKKFDEVIDVIHEVNGFVLQNKIARRLEDYALSYSTSSLEANEVMDIVIANNFIHEAIITTRPLLFKTTHDLNKVIDNNFGSETLPLTRSVIREYLSLFDRGGKRIDE